MADEKAPPEFMSALVTEHFVLQSTASSTISESGSRVSIYLSALSSGLVAIGFASATPHALASLADTVLPTVFILGWLCAAGRRGRADLTGCVAPLGAQGVAADR
jgi:hypothetical protein